MEKEITARLEEWWYDELNHIYWGNVYDDIRERWWEGARIHTSRVKKGQSNLKEGDTVNTLNSTYLLGKKAETVD